MKYVTRVLQPGETVVYITSFHWLVFIRAILWLILALALLVASSMVADNTIGILLKTGALLVGLIAVLSWAAAMIRRITTELAVTDRRVVFKTGLIRRHTIEINRSKVETVG